MDSTAMRRVYVEVPELPHVAKLSLLDRPGTLYINLSCEEPEGIIMIVPKEPAEAPGA